MYTFETQTHSIEKRGKNLHSQPFTKHNFMKKANVLRAIKNQLPHKCCYLSSNMLLKQIQKTNKQKNKTRKSQKLIKKEICRTNYSVKINFKFTHTTHNENRNVVDDATAKQ